MVDSNSIRALPEALRSRDSATFTGAYQTIGPVTGNPGRILKIVNNSNVDVTMSWDGVTDHDFIPASSGTVYDISTNRQDVQSNGGGQWSTGQGTQFYVKGTAGGGNSGSIYLIYMYGA
jgi:hypothetical protein